MAYHKEKAKHMKKVYLDKNKIGCLSDLAKELGISRQAVSNYVNRGTTLKTVQEQGLEKYLKENYE